MNIVTGIFIGKWMIPYAFLAPFINSMPFYFASVINRTLLSISLLITFCWLDFTAFRVERSTLTLLNTDVGSLEQLLNTADMIHMPEHLNL